MAPAVPIRPDRLEDGIGGPEQRGSPRAVSSGRRDASSRLEARGDGPRLVQAPHDPKALFDKFLGTPELAADHDGRRKRTQAGRDKLRRPAGARELERLFAALDRGPDVAHG